MRRIRSANFTLPGVLALIEILDFLDFTADGKSAFLKSSIGADTARVVEKNIVTGAEKVVASSDEVDAGNVQIHPRKHVRMGNVDDPKDAELIQNASTLFKADKIVRPLLIGQVANDPRVKQAESEQIVAAIEKNGGKVIYALYPDEGHGFARPENRIDFNARAEAFLAQNLGGRAEPVQGDKYPGSTAVVKVIGR